MAAEVQSVGGDRSWYEMRAKRTQAMPTHTLFGSTLENFSDKEMQDIRKLDPKGLEIQQVAQQRKESDLPQQYKARLLSREDVMNETKAQIIEQRKRVEMAQKNLGALEERSKYWAVGVEDSAVKKKRGSNKPQWLSKKDLEHAGDMNKVGLNERSYNRDKYQQKAPNHQYSYLGDVLKPGMDFAEPQLKESVKQPVVYHRHKRPDQLPRDLFYGKPTSSPTSSIDLPPNIKHLFGTKICNSVLADMDKVRETAKVQADLKASFHRSRSAAVPKDLPPDNIDPTYESLGNALRQNVFPGYTYNHHQSLAKEIYTNDVHKNRVPDPDVYRYQRDELSTWAEQNVLRERVKKAWDSYLAETSQKQE